MRQVLTAIGMMVLIVGCGVSKEDGAKKLAKLNSATTAMQGSFAGAAAGAARDGTLEATLTCPQGGSAVVKLNATSGDASGTLSLTGTYTNCKAADTTLNGGPFTIAFSLSGSSATTGSTTSGSAAIVYTYDGEKLTVTNANGTDTYEAHGLKVTTEIDFTATTMGTTAAGSVSVKVKPVGAAIINGATLTYTEGDSYTVSGSF